MKFSPYTDLALETAENICRSASAEGVSMKTEKPNLKNTTITSVNITSQKGAETMGKPCGTYITLESSYIKENDIEAHEELISILSKYIKSLCPKNTKTTLVIGLGNYQVTPDALGPKVVDKVLVTRHIKESVPQDINNSVSSVAALAPGVMGMTGIETVEVVKGVTDHVKPDLVIAVDALAARKVSRVNSTIQLSDTGVAPGAGVGNKRKTIDKETLGVPVIAIGVPTVVDAATMANDTIERVIEALLSESKKGSSFYNMLKDTAEEEKYSLIREVLDPYAENMFVTPKEVDAVMENLVNIISNSINIALHPGIEPNDINRYKF
ncbi:MAG: GPR endopeptidase [Clostridia bacterium]|nr:GPR endopeptidase [Clostridia bacterium]